MYWNAWSKSRLSEMHLTFLSIFYQCDLNAFTHGNTLFPAGCTGINILTIFVEKRVLN